MLVSLRSTDGGSLAVAAPPIGITRVDLLMPMRVECKQYESRTYANGETVRKCNLDLAPEAPWRCPDDCPAYEPRFADVNWVHGTVASPVTEEEPEGEEIAALLDEAEDIVNAAGPEILREIRAEDDRRSGGGWRRLFRRKS